MTHVIYVILSSICTPTLLHNTACFICISPTMIGIDETQTYFGPILVSVGNEMLIQDVLLRFCDFTPKYHSCQTTTTNRLFLQTEHNP
mmetsp:Transcript_3260/g.3946  ORF Transcript_3260/g.3946 Transcript_3260/m.3946 type:complete len:88 (+) Transcript_3260:137-400(+)